MITLDPEIVGSLAPPSKLTTTTTFDGKPAVDIPFARLPRLDRLRVQGKSDETEVVDENDDGGEDADGAISKPSKEEREKRKMRGKGKSLKRSVLRFDSDRCLSEILSSLSRQVPSKATQECNRSHSGLFCF